MHIVAFPKPRFFFFFGYLNMNLPVYLASLSCCMTQIQPSLSCWTDGNLMFVWRIFWYKLELYQFAQWLWASKHLWLQTETTLSPLRQHGWQLVWGLCGRTLCVSTVNELKALSWSCAGVVFLVGRGFFIAMLIWHVIFVKKKINYCVMNINGSWDVAFKFFFIFLNIYISEQTFWICWDTHSWKDW